MHTVVKIAYYEKVHTFLHCVYSKVPIVRTDPILHTIVNFFEMSKKNVPCGSAMLSQQKLSRNPLQCGGSPGGLRTISAETTLLSHTVGGIVLFIS